MAGGPDGMTRRGFYDCEVLAVGLTRDGRRGALTNSFGWVPDPSGRARAGDHVIVGYRGHQPYIAGPVSPWERLAIAAVCGVMLAAFWFYAAPTIRRAVAAFIRRGA